MSKYGEIIKAAKQTPPPKQDTLSSNTGNPESRNSSPKEQQEIVTLAIKVPKNQRIHWVTEAKRHGSTLTADIIEGLTGKYGLPDSE